MLSSLYRAAYLRCFEGAWKGRRTRHYWSELEASQWLPRSVLEQSQLESLRRFLAHAYRETSYYRRTCDQLGLRPEAVTSLAEFARWPLLTKQIIKDNRADLRAALPPSSKVLTKATGGSSGEPLQFELSMESHERRTAATYRAYSWAGAEPGTRQLYLWGVPLGKRSRLQRLKQWCWDRLQRRLVWNCFDLSRETLSEFVRTLRRYRPTVIIAYVNPLYQVAKWLDELQLVPYSPSSIVVGAEKLHRFQRELIERVFRTRVFETYGCREFMIIGGECDRHTGLHLTTENLIVEIVDEAGRPAPPGVEGDIVITDLTNHRMPFIRYANGDRAVAGFDTCPCGRGLPLLRRVTGRHLDVIETPDGRTVAGEFFPHLIKDYPSVDRFQVVQLSRDSLELRLVVGPHWASVDRDRLLAEVGKVVGPLVRLEIRCVDDIPLTRQGKHRVVVNEVAMANNPAPRST